MKILPVARYLSRREFMVCSSDAKKGQFIPKDNYNIQKWEVFNLSYDLFSLHLNSENRLDFGLVLCFCNYPIGFLLNRFSKYYLSLGTCQDANSWHVAVMLK